MASKRRHVTANISRCRAGGAGKLVETATRAMGSFSAGRQGKSISEKALDDTMKVKWR